MRPGSKAATIRGMNSPVTTAVAFEPKIGRLIRRFRSEVGDWLHDEPAEGWTQAALAAESGVSVDTIRAIEQGRGHAVGFLTAVHLCHAMGLSVRSVTEDYSGDFVPVWFQPEVGLHPFGLLGRHVRDRRQKRNWSRPNLTARTDIPLATLARLEGGGPVGLSLGKAVTLAKVFGVEIAMFEYCRDVARPRPELHHLLTWVVARPDW